MSEGVVEHLINGGGGDAKAGGGIAVNHQRLGEAVILLVGGDVAKLGHGAGACFKARRPGVQFVDIGSRRGCTDTGQRCRDPQPGYPAAPARTCAPREH